MRRWASMASFTIRNTTPTMRREYGPSWAGPEQRLKFYTSKMNQMKKKADAAKNEVHGDEAAGEKATTSKPSNNK